MSRAYQPLQPERFNSILAQIRRDRDAFAAEQAQREQIEHDRKANEAVLDQRLAARRAELEYAI